jgi:hypothetical protein
MINPNRSLSARLGKSALCGSYSVLKIQFFSIVLQNLFVFFLSATASNMTLSQAFNFNHLLGLLFHCSRLYLYALNSEPAAVFRLRQSRFSKDHVVQQHDPE